MPGKIPTVKYTKLFINGEFVDAVSKKTFADINPATEEKIADIAEGDKADVEKAVAAAKTAFQIGSPWRTMDASKRGELLRNLSDLMERDLDILTGLEVLDVGKTWAAAKGDVELSIKCMRYFAGWADKIHGDTIPIDGKFFCYTRKEPIGVVGQIIPWNFPLLMLSWKWGPSLAAGCTVVMKPAEQSPLSALHMAALSVEVGFPKGVINMVPGFGPSAGQAIAWHKDISKVAFTGSTEVGKLVMEAAAKSNLKKVSLELGGKNPIVVFDDADIDEAVKLAHDACFINHGQTCCAGTRTFVHEKIYDQFVTKSKELAMKRTVGDPWTQVDQGPQVDTEQFNKILKLIEQGKDEGAKLECGGSRAHPKGYYVQPTVFSNVEDGMTIAKEEIFGPVQSILKFKTPEEVIKRANNTNYGLSSGIVTKDINKALMFAQSTEAGNVWVNAFNVIVVQSPFGGFKESGLGRENGPEAIHEYVECKTVVVAIDEKNS